MNRAKAVRYGNQCDAVEEGLPILSRSAKIEQSLHQRNYSTIHDSILHPFGSHQILVSCLRSSQNSLSTFASRDVPLTIVYSILSFLDSKSLSASKVLSKVGPLSILKLMKECSKSQQPPHYVKKFGSKARLAMMILSERLFPAVNNVTSHAATEISDLETFDLEPTFSTDGEIKSETQPVLHEINESVDSTARNFATVSSNFLAIIHLTVFASIIFLVLFLLKS